MFLNKIKSFIPFMNKIVVEQVNDLHLPNVNLGVKRRIRDSKKFIMAFTALAVLFFAFFASVACLWLMPIPLAPHLVVMYSSMIHYVAIIALGVAGIEGVTDVTNGRDDSRRPHFREDNYPRAFTKEEVEQAVAVDEGRGKGDFENE